MNLSDNSLIRQWINELNLSVYDFTLECSHDDPFILVRERYPESSDEELLELAEMYYAEEFPEEYYEWVIAQGYDVCDKCLDVFPGGTLTGIKTKICDVCEKFWSTYQF